MTQLLDFLNAHADGAPISFHMPGHKGMAVFQRFGYEGFFRQLADKDITEIPGADNLYVCGGVLGALARRYAALYGVPKSWLLVNGSTAGILAAVLAAVPRGGKLILAGNSHKSVHSAVRLGGIQPVEAATQPHEIPGAERIAYAYAQAGYSPAGAVAPEEVERLAQAHPDASAVILASPNYFGVCSDIAGIARVCRSAGMSLIVDQAHGAHLKFFGDHGIEGFPPAAEGQGADLVVNSTHKTLASFTQSAVLNLCTDRVDPAKIEDALGLVQSTSPSYLLLASLDLNARLIEGHGDVLFREWADNLALLRPFALRADDPTKLLIDCRAFGRTGAETERMLNERHRIFPELSAGDLLLCMTGIGGTRAHYESLRAALESFC